MNDIIVYLSILKITSFLDVSQVYNIFKQKPLNTNDELNINCLTQTQRPGRETPADWHQSSDWGLALPPLPPLVKRPSAKKVLSSQVLEVLGTRSCDESWQSSVASRLAIDFLRPAVFRTPAPRRYVLGPRSTGDTAHLSTTNILMWAYKCIM